MKTIDALISAFCGFSVAFIADDFLRGFGAPGWAKWFFYFGFPLLSIICLKIAFWLAKKIHVILQVAKFILVGAFADVIDIKAYQILFFVLPLPIPAKTFSFLLATLIKYGFNKNWAFAPSMEAGLPSGKKYDIKEIAQFFFITLLGLSINLVSFYIFVKIIGPQWQINAKIWTEMGIIFAALASAAWNFLGYKFFVFSAKGGSASGGKNKK